MDSWLDRPLSVAGKIIVRDGERLTEKLIHMKNLLMIPRLAIHMKRGAEDDALNPQIHMLPVLGEPDSRKDIYADNCIRGGCK